jgi:hypothetical protein
MYKFSTYVDETANNDINLRHELNLLHDSFSINVLYIRNNKFVRCSCFNDLEKTGNPDCLKCFGSGYFASIQKFRAIESSTSPYSSNNQTQPKPIGAIDYKEEVYYFDYSVAPRMRDYILIVTWKNNKPVDVVKVLEISNIYEMRGDNGRIEVYGAHITNKPDSVKQFNSFLKKLPEKALRIIGKGGKYIWPMSLLT